MGEGHIIYIPTFQRWIILQINTGRNNSCNHHERPYHTTWHLATPCDTLRHLATSCDISPRQNTVITLVFSSVISSRTEFQRVPLWDQSGVLLTYLCGTKLACNELSRGGDSCVVTWFKVVVRWWGVTSWFEVPSILLVYVSWRFVSWQRLQIKNHELFKWL